MESLGINIQQVLESIACLLCIQGIRIEIRDGRLQSSKQIFIRNTDRDLIQT